MSNPNFLAMLHAMSALDEPMRRQKPHKQPKQAKTWRRNRQAERQYVTSLNTHWKGEKS
jgi:hypothetical protein